MILLVFNKILKKSLQTITTSQLLFTQLTLLNYYIINFRPKTLAR